MKALFIKYKSVIKFILTFLAVYICCSLGYKFYLQFSDGSKYYPDYFTNLVAYQSEVLLNNLSYETQVVAHPDEPSIKLIVNGNYLARVIEGCNSISVIILFVSFIIAFSGKWKITLFYALAGSVLVYAVNLFRIVLMSIALHHYPEYKDVLHDVVFPGIIYGLVFFLWIFWVNRFSKLKLKGE